MCVFTAGTAGLGNFFAVLKFLMLLICIARQHTDMRYWYSSSVRPSVRLSVCLSITFQYSTEMT